MNKNMIRRFVTTTAAAALFAAPAIALAPAAIAESTPPVSITTEAPEGYDWMYDELEGEYVLVPQVGLYGIVPLTTDVDINDLSVSGDDDFVGDLDNEALAGHGIAAVSIELGDDFDLGSDYDGEGTDFVCADDDGNIVECLTPAPGDIDRSHLARPVPGVVGIEPISAQLNPVSGSTESSPAVTAGLIGGSAVVLAGSVFLALRRNGGKAKA